MAVKRLFVVADSHDLGALAKALISVGVAAEQIHISKDQLNSELTSLGVRADVPSGELEVSSRYKIDTASQMGVP
ncbi:hypothetical protein KKH39_01405 [Patescibacteria group bacterium]|nr:hypothetical protein [Patescibacteria group bacterium]